MTETGLDLPDLAIVFAGINAGGGCCIPAIGAKFQIVDPRVEFGFFPRRHSRGFFRTFALNGSGLFDGNLVHRFPLGGVARQMEYAAVGAGYERASCALFEREHVAPAEAG